jgi:uncharacterized protein (DUF1919 family)
MHILEDIQHNIRYLLRKKAKPGHSVSLICNNCTAGFVLHELKLRFDKPTINLAIQPDDYLYLLEHFDEITDKEFTDITGESKYPIGLLDGKVRVEFIHYTSFEKAVDKWLKRCKRIDRKHLYVTFVARDGYNIDHLKRFDSLPFENKIAFTNKYIKGIKNQFVIKGYENDKELGLLNRYADKKGHRYYEQFNWHKFLELNEQD